MTEFSSRVLGWFDHYGRKHLPWQQSRDPYRIWVSEIMLQQTQVQTVIPYFERFMRSFPDVVSLADADIDRVLSHWSGLGYYARARNLHKAARQVRDGHDGRFPRKFDDVVALPGIGRSTAGAILALSHGDRYAILDGNVKRVLARHAAIEGWPGKTAVLKKLWELAEARTPDERLADYTQAIMDLGATLCTRSRPGCAECPVSDDCSALAGGDVLRYPGRKARKVKPLRKTTMVLAVSDGAVFMQRRPPSGIWGGLWGFPEVDDAELDGWSADVLGASVSRTETWDVLRHSFSHFDLDIVPVFVQLSDVSSTVADSDDTAWFPLDGEPPGGIAAPVTKLMQSLKQG